MIDFTSVIGVIIEAIPIAGALLATVWLLGNIFLTILTGREEAHKQQIELLVKSAVDDRKLHAEQVDSLLGAKQAEVAALVDAHKDQIVSAMEAVNKANATMQEVITRLASTQERDRESYLTILNSVLERAEINNHESQKVP